MKRLFALLLIFVMLAASLLSCGSEDEALEVKESSKGLAFKLNDDEKGYTLVGIGTCTDENIFIDGYEGLPVTEIRKDSMKRQSGIKTVTIGDNVKKVGEVSFYECENLSAVTFGKNVETIGKNAFGGCTSLTEVVIPAKVTKINERTFSGCTALKSVKLHNSVDEIRRYSFENCTSLTSIAIPASVEFIRPLAFEGCYSLAEVINRSAIKLEIGSEENGMAGYYARIIHGGNSVLVTEGDYLFCPTNDTNYLVKYLGSETELTLPNNFKDKAYVVAPYAFTKNTSITKVGISDGVGGIGNNAFEGATSLKTVSLSDTVLAIGSNAFGGCVNLQSFDFGDGVQVMGTNAFSGCTALESIVLPSSLNQISAGAFSECGALASVDFSKKEGWKAKDTAISADDLADKSKAATYLTDVYKDLIWINK